MQKKVFVPKDGEDTPVDQKGATTQKKNGGGRQKPPSQPTIPARYKIAQAEGEDFNIETCMNNFSVVENPYEKASDAYFDSYAHFHIHEEMLKDRVLI